MTVFLIREPNESPRTVQLRTRGQTLETNRGMEPAMLELARYKLAADELFEASGRSLLPLTDGTQILSCEVTL